MTINLQIERREQWHKARTEGGSVARVASTVTVGR